MYPHSWTIRVRGNPNKLSNWFHITFDFMLGYKRKKCSFCMDLGSNEPIRNKYDTLQGGHEFMIELFNLLV